jgi:hypothetical protein
VSRVRFHIADRAQLLLDTNFYLENYSPSSVLLVYQSPSQIKIPQTLWQAVRERILPGFWLRRFPVKYTVFHARAYLPELNLLPPRHDRRYVEFWHEDLPQL